MFIKGGRQRAWEEARLDASVLICPRDADDIHIDTMPGMFGEDHPLPQDIFRGDMTAIVLEMDGYWGDLMENADVEAQMGDRCASRSNDCAFKNL